MIDADDQDWRNAPGAHEPGGGLRYPPCVACKRAFRLEQVLAVVQVEHLIRAGAPATNRCGRPDR